MAYDILFYINRQGWVSIYPLTIYLASTTLLWRCSSETQSSPINGRFRLLEAHSGARWDMDDLPMRKVGRGERGRCVKGNESCPQAQCRAISWFSFVPAGQRPESPTEAGRRTGNFSQEASESDETGSQTDSSSATCGPPSWVLPKMGVTKNQPAFRRG